MSRCVWVLFFLLLEARFVSVFTGRKLDVLLFLFFFVFVVCFFFFFFVFFFAIFFFFFFFFFCFVLLCAHARMRVYFVVFVFYDKDRFCLFLKRYFHIFIKAHLLALFSKYFPIILLPSNFRRRVTFYR